MQKYKITFANISVITTDEDGNSVSFGLNKPVRSLQELKDFLDKVEKKIQPDLPEQDENNDIPF